MVEKETILKAIRETVHQFDPEAEVVLFGSRARGDYKANSDWDILILNTHNNTTWAYKQLLFKRILSIELKLGITISTVIRNKEDWQASTLTWFYQEVEKDGKVLF